MAPEGDISNLVPEENLATYCYLFCIETGLRELVVSCLSAVAGSRWYTHRLPDDVLAKYKKAIEQERVLPWSHVVPHHPIYYVDFPDLRKIIERGDNWRDVFEAMFVRREILTATLSELDPIRNKIAHSRKVSSVDLLIVKSAYRSRPIHRVLQSVYPGPGNRRVIGKTP